MARLKDDVPIDGGGFSELEVTIDEVRQVGEIESEGLLILTEPFIEIGVFVVFKLNSCVGGKKSWNLSETSDTPVS